MERLKRRTDFRAAAGAMRAPGGRGGAFVLQARDRADDGAARVGFTVSRQVGNAVQRNRVRRRLREIARLGAAGLRTGHDYVLVGRRAALDRRFEEMMREFDTALRRIHASKREPTGGAGDRTPHEAGSPAVPRPMPRPKPRRIRPTPER